MGVPPLSRGAATAGGGRPEDRSHRSTSPHLFSSSSLSMASTAPKVAGGWPVVSCRRRAPGGEPQWRKAPHVAVDAGCRGADWRKSLGSSRKMQTEVHRRRWRMAVRRTSRSCPDREARVRRRGESGKAGCHGGGNEEGDGGRTGLKTESTDVGHRHCGCRPHVHVGDDPDALNSAIGAVEARYQGTEILFLWCWVDEAGSVQRRCRSSALRGGVVGTRSRRCRTCCKPWRTRPQVWAW
jgi:hypothetical protein